MGHEEDAEKWMLLDAVGSMWDEGYSYYLKHRSPGEVDDEGKPKSTVLGATDIKGDYDCFSFKICGADRDKDIGLMFDNWDGDFDIGMTTEEQLWAVWTYSKRAILWTRPLEPSMAFIASRPWRAVHGLPRRAFH